MSRASQWDVIRRCLRMIARLEQGPASRDELVALGGYLDVPASAARKRFENDMKRLRDGLDIDIGYDFLEKRYELRKAGSIPLLDLPDDGLKGLAFLEDTFEIGTPQYQNIQSLLSVLSALLADERRTFLMRARAALNVNLRQRDHDVLDEEVWNKLETALLQRRIVTFDYLSPLQEDQQPRQHTVEARRLYFDTVRSHYYLWGYCRSTIGPQGPWFPKSYFRYRIGRIIPDSVQVEVSRFPALLPVVPTYDVIYRLVPKIARLGVSDHFENITLEIEEDGSAVVHAETDDVFYAARTLLYYGANCKVLGGREVLSETRRILQDMAKLYEILPG
jgi:predicted DNA-binding transcriptional regulator YafY